MARVILESGGERREYKVSGPITVGRSKSATITVDDKILSREHTRIYSDNGRYYVKDLESKNGTFINGSLVRGAEPLKHGDKLKIGPALLTFVLDAGEQAAAAAAVAPPPVGRSVSRPITPKPISRPVTPAPVMTARTAPRPRPQDGEVSSALGFVFNVFLFLIVGAGAYVFKILFISVFRRIHA